MVDFNNEATIGTPAIEIVRVLILQRMDNALEGLEYYNKAEIQGGADDGHLSIVKCRLKSLYLMTKPALKRQNQDMPELQELLNSNKIEDLTEGFNLLISFLDEIRLIRLDTKPSYNRKRVELDNFAGGYQ